ncbi:hypothetical protein BOTBODRAFT_129351 [Botryobasidium botryosum FD-172 SS1]|uniref:Rap-GAP domain-containing protein n=1 Tax=Botryobasidium botryosum (strain FD-172 SS1) TaxID=930990 RepID=A0A067MNA2_BOTB1|nr:hypothetical protein BOTBODRAFT_129351 [Botryobasidium botryosum FD-172 SS1]
MTPQADRRVEKRQPIHTFFHTLTTGMRPRLLQRERTAPASLPLSPSTTTATSGPVILSPGLISPNPLSMPVSPVVPSPSLPPTPGQESTSSAGIPSIEYLLVILTPPSTSAIPRSTYLAYVHALATKLPSMRPSCSVSVLAPILEPLCASPIAALRRAGFDLLSAYLGLPNLPQLSSLERATLWDALCAQPSGEEREKHDPEWSARVAAINALTQSGRLVEGFRNIVGVVGAWAEIAAGGLGLATAGEREDRERCLAAYLGFLTSVLEWNASEMAVAGGVGSTLELFDRILNASLRACVDDDSGAQQTQSMQGLAGIQSQLLGRSGLVDSPPDMSEVSTAAPSPMVSPATPMSPATPARGVSAQNSQHTSQNPSPSRTSIRQRPSSQISSPSVPFSRPSFSTSHSNPNINAITYPIYTVPATLYLAHLTQTLSSTILPSTHLRQTITTLTLLLSHTMTPVPPLSVHSLNPTLGVLERDTWSALKTLLGGPYAIGTARLLKQLLVPSALSSGANSMTMGTGVGAIGVRCAEGAARAMRFALRRAAEGRMARCWLSRAEGSGPRSAASGSVAGGGVSGSLGSTATQGSVGGGSGLANGVLGGGALGLGVEVGAGAPVMSPEREKEMIEFAWGQAGEAAWDLGRVAGVFGRATEKWVERIAMASGASVGATPGTEGATGTATATATPTPTGVGAGLGNGVGAEREKRVVRECLGIAEDLIDEVASDDRNLGLEEGRVVGEIIAAVVKCVAKSRMPDGSPCVIDLRPSVLHSSAEPLQVVLTQLLSRLPFACSAVPSLPRTLLSVPECLSDHTASSLINYHLDESLITPSSPAWIFTFSDLFESFYHPSRPLSRRALAKAVKDVYEQVRDLKSYRDELVKVCLEAWERTLPSEVDVDVVSDALFVLGGRIIDGVLDESDENEIDKRTLSLIYTVAEESECVVLAEAQQQQQRSQHPVEVPEEQPSLATNSSPSRSPLPVSSPDARERNRESIGATAIPLMSLITNAFGASAPQAKDAPSVAPSVDAPPESAHSNVPSPDSLPNHSRCKSLSAVLTLIRAFSHLAFCPPHDLTSSSRIARAPASFQCINVFKILLSLLAPSCLPELDEDDPMAQERRENCNAKQARCPCARLAILQWLVRLRADGDHRLYVRENVDAAVAPFAALLHRAKVAGADEGTGSPPAPPPRPDDKLKRNKSAIREVPAVERDSGRKMSRAGVRSPGSRSASRQPQPPSSSPPQAATPPSEPLWVLPESLPFQVPEGTRPSEGMTTYSDAGENADGLTVKLWLPVSSYVCALMDILAHEKDWEIFSYALCHMPVQLSNKHLFCGPRTSYMFKRLIKVLCDDVIADKFGSSVDHLPISVKNYDVQGVAYHLLTTLIGYSSLFDKIQCDRLVQAFQEGLNRHSTTVKPCLHALSLCCYELQPSMTKYLSKISERVSQITSNPAVSVHIIELLCIAGSVPALSANFTTDDYRLVINVALRYIQHHNRPETSSRMGKNSYTLPQHVLNIAYYLIYSWFLTIKLPDRPKLITDMTRKLLIANEPRGEVDEPTEVCFDWLARYTYGNANPKPSRSLLGDLITSSPGGDSRAAVNEKSWLLGNSIVTIRALQRPGWLELESRRASGLTRFVCKLENLALMGLGDVSEELIQFPPPGREASHADASAPAHEPGPTPKSSDNAQGQSQDESNPPPDLPPLDVEPPSFADANGIPPSAEEPQSDPTPTLWPKDVTIDPSYMAILISPYPDTRRVSAKSKVLPSTETLKRLIRTLDHTPVIDLHKVGILYVAPGQTDEVEILGNQHGSPAYTRFLAGLGRLIRLKDQRDVYTAGLDSYADADGQYAYAWWDDTAQIVYHTATLMPNRPQDAQFAGKKRHIGNDWVRIVWNDSGLPYKFDTLRTQFQFVNIVIEPNSAGTTGAYSDSPHEHEYFKVTCQRAAGMPEFGPIGEFKLISARSLPLYIRHVSLLADFFTLIYDHTSRDTAQNEYITNWRARLQAIKRYRKDIFKDEPETEQDGVGAGADTDKPLLAQASFRDFSTVY